MPKDKFGPLEYVIHDIIFRLPRKIISEIHFIATEQLVLNFSGLDKYSNTECYSAVPLYTDGVVSKMDAQIIIKQYIWNTFFDFSVDIKYCEMHHYPIAFRYNLKNKLHIKNIDSLDNLQEFTVQIMNAVFDRVVYIYDSTLLTVANDVCKGIVKMEGDTTYKIKDNYKYWLM